MPKTTGIQRMGWRGRLACQPGTASHASLHNYNLTQPGTVMILASCSGPRGLAKACAHLKDG